MSIQELDTMPIRRRLEKLKIDSGMDALEFCKIYAPEKCDKSEANARNFISQVFSGGTSINNKPVSINIEHLLNIVNSDKFPDVTLDYLVYGDETPTKTIEKIDTNPENWTIADFCIFLGRLMDNQQCIKTDTVLEEEPFMLDGQEMAETMRYFAIKILDYDGLSSSGYDLGNAISEFVSHYDEMKKISSKSAQEFLYDKIKNAVYSDERYSKQLLTSHTEDSFFEYDETGQVFIGLKLE